MLAVNAEAIKNGARLPTRSLMNATTTVRIVARAYGGMVSSCADAALYPRSSMIVGRKRLRV
jgi:hypothetical protein